MHAPVRSSPAPADAEGSRRNLQELAGPALVELGHNLVKFGPDRPKFGHARPLHRRRHHKKAVPRAVAHATKGCIGSHGPGKFLSRSDVTHTHLPGPVPIRSATERGTSEWARHNLCRNEWQNACLGYIQLFGVDSWSLVLALGDVEFVSNLVDVEIVPMPCRLGVEAMSKQGEVVSN